MHAKIIYPVLETLLNQVEAANFSETIGKTKNTDSCLLPLLERGCATYHRKLGDEKLKTEDMPFFHQYGVVDSDMAGCAKLQGWPTGAIKLKRPMRCTITSHVTC